MTEESDFLEMISQDPKDFHTYRVLADWYRDHGHDRWAEACQRIAELGWVPYFYVPDLLHGAGLFDPVATNRIKGYFYHVTVGTADNDTKYYQDHERKWWKDCLLPHDWFLRIPPDREDPSHWWRNYDTIIVAVKTAIIYY